MNYHSCEDCGEKFLVDRAFCPRCHSERIQKRQIETGRVISVVHLVATPEPYPDQYSLVLAEAEGVKFFCRSTDKVARGDPVKLSDTDDGLICSLQGIS
ncbi:hypothetical protein ApAK_07130 [Thermoplasmatales archaeon AK]|nr:hypothetical protein [Thermoplasmatales archaeon AK]